MLHRLLISTVDKDMSSSHRLLGLSSFTADSSNCNNVTRCVDSQSDREKASSTSNYPPIEPHIRSPNGMLLDRIALMIVCN